MNVSYRKYNSKDRKVIEEMATQLVSYMAEFVPTRLNTPKPEYGHKYLDSVEKTIADGNGILIIAESEGEIIGYTYGYLIKQSEEELLEMRKLSVGHVEDLIVKPDYRASGIGSELINRLTDGLKEKGCTALELFTSPFCPAHEFYLKCGFKDIRVKMFYEL